MVNLGKKRRSGALLAGDVLVFKTDKRAFLS